MTLLYLYSCAFLSLILWQMSKLIFQNCRISWMNDFLGRHISSYVASWSAAQPCKSSALQTDGRTELSDGQLHPAVEDREQNEHVVIWIKIIINCDTFECWLENEVAGLRLYRAMIFSTGSWFWSGACAKVSLKRRLEQRKEKHCRRTFFSFQKPKTWLTRCA